MRSLLIAVVVGGLAIANRFVFGTGVETMRHAVTVAGDNPLAMALLPQR
jgi:hypothetical protein